MRARFEPSPPCLIGRACGPGRCLHRLPQGQPGFKQFQGQLSTDFSCFDSALRSKDGRCGRFACWIGKNMARRSGRHRAGLGPAVARRFGEAGVQGPVFKNRPASGKAASLPGLLLFSSSRPRLKNCPETSADFGRVGAVSAPCRQRGQGGAHCAARAHPAGLALSRNLLRLRLEIRRPARSAALAGRFWADSRPVIHIFFLF